jgi:predicted glycoside hydrolase/deacetylase ChbG (UPF0249 family)
MRRLIVNADDLGLTPGVTKGIVECMSGGIVSSTSLMVNMPFAPDAVRLARERELAVGVHLNLTTGRPVSPPAKVRSLVNADGSFHSHAQFVNRLTRFKVSMADICREFSAQIEAVRRLGIEPTHVDTHHHLQLWLPVAWALLRVGRRSGIRKTRTTRTTDMAVRRSRSGTWRGWPKRRYKTVVDALIRVWFQTPTWRMEASAFRVEHGSDQRSGLQEWLRLIETVERLPGSPTVEVACHPGYVDDELRENAKYVEGREREQSALMSEELQASIRRADIRMISFRDL